MKKTFLLWAVLIMAMACRLGSDGQIIPDMIDGVVPLPPNEDYGVLCFVELEDSIVANAPVFDTFASQDGGLSWKQYDLDPVGISGSGCTPSIVLQKELWATPNGLVRYRFEVGQSIEVSYDQGSSWGLAYDLSEVPWEPVGTPDPEREVIVQPGPLDAMIDPRSGHLLLAMGHAGILVGLPSGDWHWVRAGRYTLEAVSPDQIPETAEDLTEETVLLPPSTLVAPDVEIDTENNYVNALAFAPDGTVLAVSGFEGGIKLYDFRQGDLVHWQQWGQDVQHQKLYGAVFSPDGKTLVTCGTNVDQLLQIWDIKSWALIKAYEGYQTSVLDTGVYAGMQSLAIGYGQQTEIFQLPDGKEHSMIMGNLSNVSSVFFIPGTPYLAMGSSSGEVEVWDFTKTESIYYFQSTMGPDSEASLSHQVYALGYDPSEDVLMALLGNGRLIAWEVASGDLAWELVLHIPHGWYLNTAVFSEDGKLVAVGMHNGPLLVFDSNSGELLTRQWITDGGTLQRLAFSPDNQWIAAGFTTGKVRAWQVDNIISQD